MQDNNRRSKSTEEGERKMKDEYELIRWKHHMCNGITVIDGECINKHGTVIQDKDIIGCTGYPYEVIEE